MINCVQLDSEDQKIINELLESFKEKEDYKRCLEKSMTMCEILSAVNLDRLTYCSAFLLPFFENDYLDEKTILEHFNNEVLFILNTIKKIKNYNLINKSSESDNIRNMLIAISKDIRVIIIKLSSILYEARNSHLSNYNDLNRLQLEIRDVYAPLSARLGLSFIKSELQDLNFLYFYPIEYKKLSDELSYFNKNREGQIELTISKLKQLASSLNISAEIYGRVKHISSIYNKLKEKAHYLAKIYDITAVRVVVNTVDDCYAMLSAITSIYKPLSDSTFKDYIKKPKANGYQSIHTTIIADNDEPLEIQIRTKAMHEHAEYGIAAHWLYKESKSKSNPFEEKLNWIRKIIENPNDVSNEEYMEELKTDLYSGEIFVQSPQGKIIHLTENSTPIDFAYAIHSEIGNKCVGAKINGRMSTLSSILENGDVIEIITSSSSKGPSRDWIKIVKMPSSRSKINAFFKKEMKEENIKRGKAMLEQASKIKDISFSELLKTEWLDDVFEKYSFSSLDDLFASVGYGGITTSQILNKLISHYKNSNIAPIIKEPITSNNSSNEDIIVSETDNMLIRFAQCCKPVPRDEIVGFISRARGVTIHRASCPNVPHLEQSRIAPAKWNKQNTQFYYVNLIINAKNQSGALAEITKKIAENNINIVSISSSNNNKSSTIINVSIEIKSRDEVEKTISIIQCLDCVTSVFRKEGK